MSEPLDPFLLAFNIEGVDDDEAADTALDK